MIRINQTERIRKNGLLNNQMSSNKQSLPPAKLVVVIKFKE